MNKKIFTFLILLSASFVFAAGIERFDVGGSKKQSFAFDLVCMEMGYKDVSLVSAIDANTIDCMGYKLQIARFCDKRVGDDPEYMRAYVDRKSKKVICESGKHLIIALQCSRAKEMLNAKCRDSKNDCLKVKDLFAKNLPLFHHSIHERVLSCYFGKEDI